MGAASSAPEIQTETRPLRGDSGAPGAYAGSRPGRGVRRARASAQHTTISAAHAQLAGQIDRSGETTRSLLGSGFDMDSVRCVLDGMTQGQNVMLATNETMVTSALASCAAALLIWLAPRSARVIDMRKAGH